MHVCAFSVHYMCWNLFPLRRHFNVHSIIFLSFFLFFFVFHLFRHFSFSLVCRYCCRRVTFANGICWQLSLFFPRFPEFAVSNYFHSFSNRFFSLVFLFFPFKFSFGAETETKKLDAIKRKYSLCSLRCLRKDSIAWIGRRAWKTKVISLHCSLLSLFSCCCLSWRRRCRVTNQMWNDWNFKWFSLLSFITWGFMAISMNLPFSTDEHVHLIECWCAHCNKRSFHCRSPYDNSNKKGKKN